MKILIAENDRRWIDDLQYHVLDIAELTGKSVQHVTRLLESGRTIVVAGRGFYMVNDEPSYPQVRECNFFPPMFATVVRAIEPVSKSYRRTFELAGI
jgi:hypothetical protein